MDEKKEGREEGWEEGREEGREEGWEEGREEGKEEGWEEGGMKESFATTNFLITLVERMMGSDNMPWSPPRLPSQLQMHKPLFF